MCDPVTLGLAAAASVGGKLISGNEARDRAAREAAARNAVLDQTLAKEKGYAADNATEQNVNLAHYAPGSQDTQLTTAQDKRIGTSTGNITASDPNSIPITADASPAVKGEIAKRMLAVHDSAVNRAKLSGKVAGYGDTWFNNNINTQEADRNIGVTNNYAQGQKSILEPMQDLAGAAAYKPPTLWGPLLSGAGSITAGYAGVNGGGGDALFSGPSYGGGSVWDGSAWGGNKRNPLPGLNASDYG